MLCPQCGAKIPERTAACPVCGHLFPLARRPNAAAARGTSRQRQASLALTPPHAAEGARVARLAREATKGSSRPAGTPSAGRREEEEDDIFREFVSCMVEINGRVGREKDDGNREALAALYTAESFSSPEAMGRATRAVRELLRINRRISGEMERALNRCKGRIESTKWTSLEKALFWRDLVEGFAVQFQLRAKILEAQQKWTEATAEAYEFALSHSHQLHFEGKTVRSTNREVGRGFIEKLKRARICREDFNHAAARFHEEQSALLIRWGVAEPPAQ